MNIGGRVFQSRCINSDTKDKFIATYKKFTIEVTKIKGDEYGMKEYSVEVRNKYNFPFFVSQCRRCSIHDAIIYTLNEAGVK